MDEAHTAQPAYPQRVMLRQCCRIDDSCSPADDGAKTLAAARTSTGKLIQVSVRLAEDPLAASRVCIGPAVEAYDYNKSVVVAAHGDSMLIRVEDQQYQHWPSGYAYANSVDHFIYSAGDSTANPPRPPSLSLLPPVRRRHRLHGFSTGLLRRGEDDELVVAELCTDVDTEVLELYLFRSGEWTVKRPPIISYYGGDNGEVIKLPSNSAWGWDTVVPVGDRQLCWVLLDSYVLICDVFEEIPRMRYLRVPMDFCLGKAANRNVCATAGGGALKLVHICAARCERSRGAYTVHTWMLRMDDDDAMKWEKDGVIDATELWALDAYKGLPRVPLERPVVSTEEPHVVYFQLCERHHVVEHGGDDTLWLLKVDMRSKTIQSVSRHRDGFSCMFHMLVPSNVAYASNGALTMGQQTDEHRQTTGNCR